MRNMREQELWEVTVSFVEKVCPQLAIRDVYKVVDKIYRKMRFTTKRNYLNGKDEASGPRR
jgi:hypothetical protein